VINFRTLFGVFCIFIISFNISANEEFAVTEKSNLMLVVRTSFGANKPDPQLVPTGIQVFRDSDGKKHSFEMAHYDYLGDTHIRFVFDSAETMANTTPEQFDKFGLTPEEAVEVAISNIYRDYGQPNIYELESKIFQIQGDSPDFDSSYFLDKALWKRASALFNDALVVAVPSRDLLLFSPAKDKKALKFLSENVQGWFNESGSQGVSSALFIYDDGDWKVQQSPEN